MTDPEERSQTAGTSEEGTDATTAGGTDAPATGSPGEGKGGQSDPPEVPSLSAGLDREEAAALRASFAADERDRIEGTVADLLDLLGKAHAMAVLSEFAFADAPLRFTQLEDRLGVSPNTLSARLGELAEAGLLDRRSYDEIPPRVEYAPTEKAEALFPAFAHLHHWAIDHELG